MLATMTRPTPKRPPPARRTAKGKAGIWFDPKAADHAEEFFTRFLRHTKGEWAGKPFDLQPWQRDQIIRPLFGTKRADGTRVILMPREDYEQDPEAAYRRLRHEFIEIALRQRGKHWAIAHNRACKIEEDKYGAYNN